MQESFGLSNQRSLCSLYLFDVLRKHGLQGVKIFLCYFTLSFAVMSFRFIAFFSASHVASIRCLCSVFAIRSPAFALASIGSCRVSYLFGDEEKPRAYCCNEWRPKPSGRLSKLPRVKADPPRGVLVLP